MINEEIIKKQIELLRRGYDIPVYPKEIPLLCNECDIENFIFACRNGLYYEQIMLTNLGIDNPFHRASLIGFNNNDKILWFLLDPTYGQFFKYKKFRDYMFLYYYEFSQELLNNGYVECTLDNINSYINGFVFSKAFSNKINVDLVYNNFYSLLINNNVINENDKFVKKKIKKTRNYDMNPVSWT